MRQALAAVVAAGLRATGEPPGPSPDPGLTLVASGFVDSDDFNRADGAPGADWSVRDGAWAIASNRLRFRGGAVVNGVAEWLTDPRGPMFFQGVVRPTATNVRPGALARFAWNGGSIHGYFARMIPTGSPVGAVNHWELYSFLAGSATALGSADAGSLPVGADQPFQLYVANGLQQLWASGVTIAATNTAHDAATDRTAAFRSTAGSGLDALHDDPLLSTSKLVTVTGLPTGWKAKIRNAGEAVVAEATESGGTAQVDASRHGGATEVCPLAGWPELVVTNAADAIQATYSAPVYPGHQLSFTP